MGSRNGKLVFNLALVGVAVAALVGIQALAADLNTSQLGASCAPEQTGLWHFVNNQTGGAPAGTLFVSFSDAAGGFVGVSPTVVLNNNQQFNISGPAGPIQSATTTLPGKLVLSDLTCTGPTATPSPTP